MSIQRCNRLTMIACNVLMIHAEHMLLALLYISCCFGFYEGKPTKSPNEVFDFCVDTVADWQNHTSQETIAYMQLVACDWIILSCVIL